MPADDIVPWYVGASSSRTCLTDPRDFNAPVANRPADSSAATLMATGLLLLAQVENNPANVGRWTSSAIHVSPHASIVPIRLLKSNTALERYHRFGMERALGQSVVEWDGQ